MSQPDQDVESLRAAFRVVYEDELMCVVHKPSGLSVHQGWSREALVLVDLVREQLGASTVYPIHRLDRATSGLVLFAQDASGAATLQQTLSDEATQKRYLALVRGVPEAAGGFIDHPVPRDEEGERVEAQTVWRKLASAPSEPRHTSLLELWPMTGRLHQLRRHLKHISHPIIGDARYGKGPLNREFAGRYDLHRLALHAHLITMTHPHTGHPITLHSPPPDELASAWLAMGYDASCWQEAASEQAPLNRWLQAPPR
jgi:tRNA pseudouridine65 synthase